jgi:chromosome partitioning protein
VILAVVNTKGGVGKTTLAVNIAIARAIAGRDVLLVDGDEQGTAADFTQLRANKTTAADYTAMRLRGREVRTEVLKLRGKFDDIVIDVGGRDNEALRAALTTADTVLIPILPSSFDVWALDQIAALVGEAKGINEKLRALAVLNAADPVGKDNDEAQSVLQDMDGIETLPGLIVRRKAFRNAAAQGRGVLDMVPADPKAIEEMSALVAAVFDAKQTSE